MSDAAVPFDTDHVPAPADHAPRKAAIQQAGDDLLVYEVDGVTEAWILAESGVVDVTQ